MEFPIILSIILFTGFGFISNVSGDRPLNKFMVKEGKDICILAEFSGASSWPDGQLVVYRDGSSEGSNCGRQQALTTAYSGFGDPRLDFIFESNKNNTVVELVQIYLSMNATRYVTNVTEPFFSVPKGNSWKCDSGIETLLQDDPPTMEVRLLIEQVKFNAYRDSSDDKYQNEIQCKKDSTNNKTVPMIIAFVLAGMVIIMLVGYVILRRRENITAYQQVNERSS